MNRTDRLYALVEELRATAPRARSARWLADRFEVGVRTIQRDVLALQEAGVPIWATPGPGGGYTIDPAHTLPPVNFTASEAAAVALALARSEPMPFDGAARTALHKLVAAISPPGRSAATDLLGRIHLLHAKRELSADPVLRADRRRWTASACPSGRGRRSRTTPRVLPCALPPVSDVGGHSVANRGDSVLSGFPTTARSPPARADATATGTRLVPAYVNWPKWHTVRWRWRREAGRGRGTGGQRSDRPPDAGRRAAPPAPH